MPVLTSIFSDCLGLPLGKSILSRWVNPDKSFKYRAVCPIKTNENINNEPDCKVVATLMADLFRVDALRPAKEGYETNLLRSDGRALAFFNDKCGYSSLGMFIWTDFWTKDHNFGQISSLLRATDRAGIQKVAENKFTLYATSQSFVSALPDLSLYRYTDDMDFHEGPLLGGKLLALCDYMHIRALFPDKAQLDKVRTVTISCTEICVLVADMCLPSRYCRQLSSKLCWKSVCSGMMLICPSSLRRGKSTWTRLEEEYLGQLPLQYHRAWTTRCQNREDHYRLDWDTTNVALCY